MTNTTRRTERPTDRAELPAHYLTPHEVAELLRVPLETVYQWRKKRVGPPGFRVGKHLRYDPTAVREYIQSLTHDQAHAA